MKRGGVCESQWELRSANGPCTVLRLEVEVESRNAVYFASWCYVLSGCVWDHLHFEVACVHSMNDDPRVFHQAFFNGHVPHEGTNSSFF